MSKLTSTFGKTIKATAKVGNRAAAERTEGWAGFINALTMDRRDFQMLRTIQIITGLVLEVIETKENMK